MVDPPFEPIHHNNVCAVKWTGNSCTGDSGGPLSYNMVYEYELRTVQYAIVSAGIEKCADESRQIFPVIYAKVEPYLDWIIGNIKGGESVTL